MTNDEFEELKSLLEKTKKGLNKALCLVKEFEKENDELRERVDNLIHEVRKFNREMFEKLGYKCNENDEYISYFNDERECDGHRIVFWLDKEDE